MIQDFTGDLIIKGLQKYAEEREKALLKEGLSVDQVTKIIEEEIEQKDLTHISSKLIEEISDDCVKTFSEIMDENLSTEFERENNFLEHNYLLWNDGFNMSMVLYLVAIEAADDCHNYFAELSDDARKNKLYRYTVLHNLHGRACQQFLEILWLLRGGFADGAFSRCRSIYELSIVAEIISKNDEFIAQKYYEESFVDDSGNKWAKNLPEFKNQKKEWVSFKQLQDLCTIVTAEKWESMYQNTCKTIHASPQNTFKRIAVPDQDEVISVGHSDYGLAAPAINSAISLTLTTILFFQIIPSFDSKVYDRAIQKWSEKLIDVYLDIEKNCF